MGRKAKTKTTVTVNPADALVLSLHQQAVKHMADGHIADIDEFKASIKGIPLRRNLPLQYVLGVNVLPCRRIISIVGPWGSGKSSLGWDILRVCVEEGGIGVYIGTELKDNPWQFEAIINNDSLMSRVVMNPTVPVLEDMLSAVTYYCSWYEQACPKKDIPLVIMVDSLNGCAAAKSVTAAHDGDDVAGFQGARDAGTIKERLRAQNAAFLISNPITLLVVNHQTVSVKESSSQTRAGSMPAPKHEPGGGYKDYAYTTKLETRKAGTFTRGGVSTPMYKLSGGKSSLGPSRPKPIEVACRSEWTGTRERIYFDWDLALTDLLCHKFVPKEVIKSVMPFTVDGNNYSCDRLGLTKVDAGVFGAAVHSDPALITALQDEVLRIRRVNEFTGPDAVGGQSSGVVETAEGGG